MASQEIEKIKPNIILLAGGVDYGERDTALYNAVYTKMLEFDKDSKLPNLAHEKNLETIEEEVKNVEERLNSADTRPLLEKMNQIEQRLGKLTGKLTGIDSRIESLEKQKEERETRYGETEAEINSIKVEQVQFD